MKNRKTLILMYVKAPENIDYRLMDESRLEGIKNMINSSIVVPFNCDRIIRWSQSNAKPGCLVFYIFKEGKLKRSVRNRFSERVDKMMDLWPSFLGYSVLYCDGDMIDQISDGEVCPE